MTRYEILIKIGDDKYYLDTFKYDAISLNYDIANIKDISGRNSSYSKTIRLPDSEHNRQVLGFITNLAVESTVDANKAIKSWILVDTIPVFEGNLQLKKFQKNFKTGEFDIEVVVFADNDTFFTLIGDKYLTDLDFSEYDHIWSAENILSSWTASFENGYVYPLIDYGSNWAYQDVSGYGVGNLTISTYSVSVDEMFPSTYVRVIIDKIFKSVGFSYDSEFFNSDRFTKLIIPFNETFIQGPTSSGRTFRAGLDTYTHSFTPPTNFGPANELIVPFNNESSPNGDPNNLWDTTNFYYTNVDEFLYQRIGWYFDFTIPPDLGGSYIDYLWIYTYRSRDLNGATNSTWASGQGNVLSLRQVFYNNGSSYVGQWDPVTRNLKYGFRTPYANLFPGEKVRIVITSKFGNSPLTINESYVFNEIAPEIIPSSYIFYNNVIPKKIKQKDFILSLCRMFNLYIEPSKEDLRTLIIEPRDDYYERGSIKDWSKKLDPNQEIETEILGQVQDKIILYTHKDDNDAINKSYKSQINEIYGQYEYLSPNEFAKSTKKIETIFSPTPLVSLQGSFNFPIPVIVKDSLLSYNNSAQGRIQSNIRILYWGGLISFSDYGISDQFGFNNQIYPYYPYAGHLDNPYENTYDINFGQPKDIFFKEPENGLTNNNLFNTYWFKTMYELTNKDSRLLKASFLLTSDDIYQFKFSDKIYLEFDGNGQYYKVNKIIDYDPGKLKTCKVELIKAEDIKVNTFVPKLIKGKGKTPPRVNVQSVDTVSGVGTGLVLGNGNQLEGIDSSIFGNDNIVWGNSSFVRGDDNNIYGDNNTVVGDNNTTNLGTTKVFINGDSNSVDQGVKNLLVNGDSNIINQVSDNLLVVGDSNQVATASQNIYVFGNNNIIDTGSTSSTLSNVFVLGDGSTITQSNTNYIGGNTIFSGTVSFNSPNFSLNCLNIEKFNLADVDQTFLSNLGTGFNSDIGDIEVQSDGKIVIGGSFTTFNGNTRNRLIRLNSDGTEDTSFYTNLGTGFSFGSVNSLSIQSDGKILVGGLFIDFNGNVRVSLVRLNSDGTEDTSFYTNLGTSFNGTVNEVYAQPDGKILVGGSFTSLNGTTRNRLVRLNSDGTVDTTFYTNLGTAFGNDAINTITLQSDGKILIGGSFTTFNGNTRNRLIRLNSDGTEDTSFYTNLGTGFGPYINIALEQPDGKILVGGGFSTLNGNSRNNLVRLNSDGTEDTDFFNNYAGSGQVKDINLQSDGGIILAGNVTNYLMKLDSDGFIDSNFMRKLPLGFNGAINKAFVLSDDSILVSGLFDTIETQTANHFAKLSYVDACEYINGSDFITIGTVDSEIDVLGKQLDITTDSININTDSFQVNSQSDILNSTQSFVLGGDNNDITNLDKTGIICLDNITATQSDTVYMPNVKMYGDAFIQGRLDLTKLGIESILRIIPSGATPSSPLTGDVFYRDGVGLYYWNGVKWVVIGKDPVEYNQLSATQSLSINNTTSSLTDITGWTFSFDANSYYQFEGYIDASINPGSGGPNTQNFIGLCIDFTNSITNYNLTITDIQNLYPTSWGVSDSIYHIGNSRSSNTINRDAIIRGSTGRMKIEGFVRTSAATTGQFKWTYRNDANRTFNILSGSVINIIKM